MARHYYGHATAAIFAPLEPLSRSALVVRRLGDAIALGLLPEGSQLPGEVQLATTLGVSTVTVREALAVLRSEGLLETRRGRGGGSFVRLPPGGAAEIAHRRLLELSVMEVRDLGDVYSTVSGGAAWLAATRCTADDLDQLGQAAEAFAHAGTAGERRRADAQLRILVPVVAQSPRLYRAEVDLQAEIGTLLWLTLDDDRTHRADVAWTTQLMEALRRHDPERARDAAGQRIKEATTRLIDRRISLEPTP